MVSPAGFEPVYLPVMSGALLPIKLETHKPHVLLWSCYSFSRVNIGFEPIISVRVLHSNQRITITLIHSLKLPPFAHMGGYMLSRAK